MKIAAKFAFSLLVLTIVCTWLWSLTASEWLYDCTDSLPWDYLRPGDWVHPFYQGRIAVVPHIVHDRSMSEPDTIKEGWSVARLWLLWWSVFGSSVLASLLFAFVPWRRSRLPTPSNTLPSPTASDGG